MNGTTAYVLARKYVKDTAEKLGAVKGAPCKIQSITKANGLYTVTFEWKDEEGVSHTSDLTMDDLGSLVEANPAGEATVELQKLKVGNTIYSVASGGVGNFESLINRPKINNVLLTKDTTLEDLGIVSSNDSLTEEQVDDLLNLIP